MDYFKVKLGGAHQVLGSQFMSKATRIRDNKYTATKIFAIPIADVKKALEFKKKQTPQEIQDGLPLEICENTQYLTKDENSELPPHRLGVDTKILLHNDGHRRERKLPFGPLCERTKA